MTQEEGNKAIKEVVKWVKAKKQDPLNGIEEIEHILEQVNENSVLGDVSISSISHVEIGEWSKEYAPNKEDGMKRLDFCNGALMLKQKLEGTADEC